MKIAVFEPYPRTCGVTAWGYNIAHGFRDLGHECDVVSFTKSGRNFATRGKDGGARPGWQWYQDAPDVVAKWKDSPDVLNSYDLIVLNEPKNGSYDNVAKKTNKLPEYVAALHYTTTPWVTALHDAIAYTRKVAPFLEYCVGVKSFTGVAIECRPGSYACGEWALAGKVKKLQQWPWLPYRAKGRAPDVQRERIIGIGGRMSTSKGYASLAHVAHEVPPEYQVHMFGSEAGGMGPCISYLVYESMVATGWQGLRGYPGKYTDEMRTDQSRLINNYGPVNTMMPWYLQRDGRTVRYTGAFIDAVEAWTRCAIATQLSTDKIVTTFEYTTLEAIDAGCAMILPWYYQHDMCGAEYDIHWLRKYQNGARFNKKRGLVWNDDDEQTELINVINEVRDKIESGQHDPEINRKAIARYNAPHHLASKILEII